MIPIEWLLLPSPIQPILFLTIASSDAAEPWQLGSQDSATPMMQGIIDLHHDIFFFLILILVFVLWILVRALWHFNYKKNPIPERIVHGTTIEILRTIFPRKIIRLFAEIISGHTILHFYSCYWTLVSPKVRSSLLLIPLIMLLLYLFYPEFRMENAHAEPNVDNEISALLERRNRAPPQIPQQAIPIVHVVEIPEADPLITYSERGIELTNRYSRLTFGGDGDSSRLVSTVDAQLEIEIRVEAALINDGFTPSSILRNIGEIRGAMFGNEVFSIGTYRNYIRQIERRGTRQSTPYRRLLRAIHNFHILMDLRVTHRRRNRPRR